MPLIDSTATVDDDGTVTVFAVNRDPAEDSALTLDLRSFGDLKRASHIVMHHDDVKAVNTEEDPSNVSPKEIPVGTPDGGKLEVLLPRLSWNVIRIAR